MDSPLLSPKQLLLRWLETVIVLSSPDLAQLTQHQHISLYQAKGCTRFLYISPIAFHLSKAKKIPALEIANAIALLLDSQVEYCCRQPTSANLLQFTFEVVPPGWIHIEVTQPMLAAWLQQLIICPPQLENYREKEDCQLTQTDTYRLFAAQYAHARCCSILQMAHREKLITLKELPETSSAVFLPVAPSPIPWLNDQKLRYFHPAELALISQLLATLDDFYCSGTSRQLKIWEKAALNLSQIFQTFYSCCRIWGEVKMQTLELSQARLGLVMATQISLRLLLQDRLGVPALREL